MEVDPLASLVSPHTQEVRKSLNEDFDNFLLLLTTQLQNQDPTEPLDANQFTQQLVSFTGVEQAVATNENLEKMIELSMAGLTNNAVSFVGNTVEIEGNKGMMEGGSAEFFYEVDGAPEGMMEIAITDESGFNVFNTEVEAATGKQSFLWNGENNFGVQQPDGVYKIQVKAVDDRGEKLDVETYSTGRVTRVHFEDGEVVLQIGDLKVPIKNVASVGLPASELSVDEEV